MKIIVVKRDKIGDMLLTTPLLAHLRASLPQASIHVVASDYNAWVVQDNSDIDKIWAYPRVRNGNQVSFKAAWKFWKIRRALRREKFDVVIVGNGAESPRAIALGTAIGAKQVIAAFPADRRYRGVTERVEFDPRRHEIDALLALAAPLGIPPPATPAYPKFVLPGAWQDQAVAWLNAENLKPSRYAVIGLGARRAKKQPSCDQILRWSAWLTAAHGLCTVFMWTPGGSDNPLYPGDDAVAQPVLDARSPNIVPFRGKLNPAIALVWNAAFSIFPDSGLMHFGAASPGGVLGLFAETAISPHPDQWGPRGARAAYLEAKNSVSEIRDEDVFGAITRLISS
jgi:heptosyltransferase III